MKRILNFALAAGALALAGCSSTPAKVDTGPIQARTFSFVNPGAKPAPDFADNTQAIHAMVQAAITTNLVSKGLTKVENGGDVTVGYLIIVGNNASTMAINDYFGFSEDVTALHNKAQEAYTSSKNPNFFEAGTLLIDIADSRSFKLLKRGYATRPILRNISDSARAERIQGVVDEILADLRVKQ